MDDMTSGMKVGGNIVFAGKNINDWRNVYALRRQIMGGFSTTSRVAYDYLR